MSFTHPQNPTDESVIEKTVLDAIASKPCQDFAATVLGAQKRKGLGTLTDVAKAFFALSGPCFTRNRPSGSTLGVSNPIGRISRGTAQIYSLGNDATLTANQQMLDDADNAISELFHLAAEGSSYTDEDLANAVHNSSYAADAYAPMSNGKPLIDPRSNIFDPTYIPSTAYDVAKLSQACEDQETRCQFTLEDQNVMIVFSGSKIGALECERVPKRTVLAIIVKFSRPKTCERSEFATNRSRYSIRHHRLNEVTRHTIMSKTVS